MKSTFYTAAIALSIFGCFTDTQAQISGSINVPSSNYPSLAAVIDSLNAQGLGPSGASINFNPTQAEITPVGGYVLGSSTLNASLSASRQLTFHGNGHTLYANTGQNTSSDAIFSIQGADYVTIDGFRLKDSSAHLNATTKAEWGIVLCKRQGTGAIDGCQHNIIQNCIIELDGSYSKTVGIYGKPTTINSTNILPATGINKGSTNSFNSFYGNQISGVTNAILLEGFSAPGYYDQANEIGGISANLGNTFIIGGGGNTSIGIQTKFDSIITIQHNQFSIAASQGDASVYFYLPSSGRGNLTFSDNHIDISGQQQTASVYGFYNLGNHSDAGNAAGQLQSTHTLTNNSISGSQPSLSSGSVFGIFSKNAWAKTTTIASNSLNEINLGNATGTFYGLYGEGVGNIKFNNNQFLHFSKLGNKGSSALFTAHHESAAFGTLEASDNVIRGVNATDLLTCYNFSGSLTPPIAGNNAATLIAQHNVLDSVTLSGVKNAGVFCNMGQGGHEGSIISHDTITNIHITNTAANTVEITLGMGSQADSNYLSRSHYIANISGVGTATEIRAKLGWATSVLDSCTIEHISLTGKKSAIDLKLGESSSGDISHNLLQDWTLAGGATVNLAFAMTHTGTFRYNTIRNIIVLDSGSFIGTGPSAFYSKLEYDHNRWEHITVDSGTLQLIGTSNIGANCIIHDNILNDITLGRSNMTPLIKCFDNNGTTLVFNNSISGIRLRSGVNVEIPAAVSLQGANKYLIYNNTIGIDSTANPGNDFCLSGIVYENQSQLELRNNIINLNQKSGTNGYLATLRRASGTSGQAPLNFLASSDNNIYHVPHGANAWLYAEGDLASGLVNKFNLNNDPQFNTSCGLFKAFIGHDHLSGSEDNLHPGSISGTVAPSGTSLAKQSARTTHSVADSADLNGVFRPTLFDIGALQFSGTTQDSVGPSIHIIKKQVTSYCINCPDTIMAIIQDVSLVDTSSANAPRLYYKMALDSNTFLGNTSSNNGWKFVPPSVIVGDTFVFHLDCTKFRTTLSYGDSISYFIIAQDRNGSPKVNSEKVSFSTCPSSVALTSANFPTLNWPIVNGYRILPTPTLFHVNAFPMSACENGATTLSIYPKPAGTQVQWQSASLSGSFSNISGANADTFATGILSTTKRYRAQIFCSGSLLATTDIDTFFIAHPTLSGTVGDTLCGYGTATLQATTSTPSVIPKWFASANSGTPLHYGTSFTTPNISSTTTYFVTASSIGTTSASVGLHTPGVQAETMYNYGLEIKLYGPKTTFYSTTVYPQGSGTMNVELTDLQTGSPAKDIHGNNIPIRSFVVSGNGTKATPNVLNLNWVDILPGSYSINIVLGGYTAGLYLGFEYNLNLQYPYQTTGTCAEIVGPTYNNAPYPYDYYYYFFYDNIVSCDCDSIGRIPVTAMVTPAPAITLSNPAYPGICTGQSAVLSVSSINSGYSYTWTPGSLSTSSITVSPTNTTLYQVVAHDASTGCTAIDSTLLYVDSIPSTPIITPHNPTICAGSAIKLSAQTKTSVSWTPIAYLFQDSILAIPVSSSDTGAQVFAAPDSTHSYIAIARAHGCSSLPSSPDTIFVLTGPDVTLTLSGSDTVCSGDSAQLCVPNHLHQQYQWYYNDTVLSGATQPCLLAGHSGLYYVRVQDSSTGCVSISKARTIYILPAPTATITSINDSIFCIGGEDTLVCSGTGIVQYQWLRNKLPISGAIKSVFVANSSGSYTCVGTNANGCHDTSNAIQTQAIAPNVSVSSAGPLSICTGGTVNLQATAAPSYSYVWYQGGILLPGQTFNTFNATTSGSYYVRIVDASTGCADTSRHFTINIGSTPSASVRPTGSINICAGDSARLVTNTDPGLHYQWKNGGVNITPGGQDSVLWVTATGSYSVVVSVVAMPSCKDSSAVATHVTVHALPSATTTISGGNTICQGDSIVLQTSPTSGMHYQWLVNDTLTGKSDTTRRFVARKSGSYTALLVDTATGCADTSNNIVVTVNPIPPIKILSAAVVQLCGNDSVVLQSNISSNTQYTWYKNGTAIIPSSTGASYVAKSAGWYSVTVIDSSTHCQASSAAISVLVDSLPIAAIRPAGPITICASNPISIYSTYIDSTLNYQWRRNGSDIIGAIQDSLITNLAGQYVLVLTKKLSGCVDTSLPLSISMTTTPSATITAIGKTKVCFGDTVKLKANTGVGYTYEWAHNGIVLPGQNSDSLSAYLPGTYTVLVKKTQYCSTQSSGFSVQIDSLPPAFISYTNTDICFGDSVLLQANTGIGYQYTWNNGGSTLPDTLDHIWVSTSGSYEVRIQDSNGCSNLSGTVTTTLHPLPTPILTLSSNVFSTTMSYWHYQWYRNDTLLLGETNRNYSASGHGLFHVVVTDSFGCEAASTKWFFSLAVPRSYQAVSVQVYPNPVTDILNIEASIPVSLNLKDALGKTVLEGYQTKQLNLSRLPQGSYQLQITDSSGRIIRVEKILKVAR
ncbi:MAG: T9SS type A sorting domain-containing protein [Bacteroidetes bacterium]|nr:T9SS type A sorting domain-containing protein [Bacteroidota bacterium]